MVFIRKLGFGSNTYASHLVRDGICAPRVPRVPACLRLYTKVFHFPAGDASITLQKVWSFPSANAQMPGLHVLSAIYLAPSSFEYCYRPFISSSRISSPRISVSFHSNQHIWCFCTRLKLIFLAALLQHPSNNVDLGLHMSHPVWEGMHTSGAPHAGWYEPYYTMYTAYAISIHSCTRVFHFSCQWWFHHCGCSGVLLLVND